MAENWANGVPDEGRSPKSRHRMAAEGIQFPWRGNGSTISTDLDGIWGMSGNSKNVRDQDTCLGYAMGVSDIMDGLQATGKSYFGHKTCATKAIQDTQVRAVVANYLKAHPKRRQYSAANLVAEALAKAWPCPLL